MTELIENLSDHVRTALTEKKSNLLPLTTEMCKSAQIKEEKIQEICVEALIRIQPFAVDLRSITTSMKVAYNVSRICRYLRNIIEIMNEFDVSGCETAEVIVLLEDAKSMAFSSIYSYIQRDLNVAKDLIKSDELIDQKYREILRKLATGSYNGICILFNGLTARIIERMADHACYIAHETIYLVTGRRIDY
ncbi:MAG: phosphate signaling complex PhoU family protein [Candidatus Methanomethylicaceae archaeon]